MRKSSGEENAMTSSSHREIRESPVAAVPDGKRIPVVLDPAARKRITQWLPHSRICPRLLSNLLALHSQLLSLSHVNCQLPASEISHNGGISKKVDVQGHAKTDAMARRGSKRDNERREQRERCS